MLGMLSVVAAAVFLGNPLHEDAVPSVLVVDGELRWMGRNRVSSATRARILQRVLAAALA